MVRAYLMVLHSAAVSVPATVQPKMHLFSSDEVHERRQRLHCLRFQVAKPALSAVRRRGWGSMAAR